MRTLLLNLLGLAGTWHLIEISSENALKAGVAPVVFIFFLISSLLWLLVNFGRDPHLAGRTFITIDTGSYPAPDKSGNGNNHGNREYIAEGSEP